MTRFEVDKGSALVIDNTINVHETVKCSDEFDLVLVVNECLCELYKRDYNIQFNEAQHGAIAPTIDIHEVERR